MQLSKVWGGQTPFITNITAFSATAISKGAFLVSGATTTAIGAIVTTTASTVLGNNYIGVTQEGSSILSQSKENLAPNSHAFRIPSSGLPSTGSNSTTGQCYMPLCINLCASYMALYSTTTGAGTASDTIGTWTASTTTVATRGSVGTDLLGGWLFSLAGVNSAGNTPTFSGSLRYIGNSSSGSDVSLFTAMNISTDSHMIQMYRTMKKCGVANTTGTSLRSFSGTSATGFQLDGARLLSIENYINADHAPTHPLRSWVDDGLNGLTGVELYSEVIFTSPFIMDQA